MELAFSGALVGFYLVTFSIAYVWETARDAIQQVGEEC